jgi:hypothetical protein
LLNISTETTCNCNKITINHHIDESKERELVLLKQQQDQARKNIGDTSSTKTQGFEVITNKLEKDRGKYFPLSKQININL